MACGIWWRGSMTCSGTCNWGPSRVLSCGPLAVDLSGLEAQRKATGSHPLHIWVSFLFWRTLLSEGISGRLGSALLTPGREVVRSVPKQWSHMRFWSVSDPRKQRTVYKSSQWQPLSAALSVYSGVQERTPPPEPRVRNPLMRPFIRQDLMRFWLLSSSLFLPTSWDWCWRLHVNFVSFLISFQ